MESPALSPASLTGSPGASPIGSPNRSRASSRASHLTLDLSVIPPLTQPAKPTNTILITNLNNLDIFAPDHINQLRDIINSTAPLASWSPLKSFRRIVCSFATTDDAIAVRQALDGEAIMGERVRVYFGEHTPLQPVDQHLQAPEAKKMFFISPPPSPPQGWESKNEDPPNSIVVAEDLAHALARLSWEPSKRKEDGGPGVEGDDKENPAAGTASAGKTNNPLIGRPRSASSVVLFEPEDAKSNEMPAISVDDYTDSGDEKSPVSPSIPAGVKFHTERPPVELIQDA